MSKRISNEKLIVNGQETTHFRLQYPLIDFPILLVIYYSKWLIIFYLFDINNDKRKKKKSDILKIDFYFYQTNI